MPVRGSTVQVQRDIWHMWPAGPADAHGMCLETPLNHTLVKLNEYVTVRESAAEPYSGSSE